MAAKQHSITQLSVTSLMDTTRFDFCAFILSVVLQLKAKRIADPMISAPLPDVHEESSLVCAWEVRTLDGSI